MLREEPPETLPDSVCSGQQMVTLFVLAFFLWRRRETNSLANSRSLPHLSRTLHFYLALFALLLASQSSAPPPRGRAPVACLNNSIHVGIFSRFLALHRVGMKND